MISRLKTENNKLVVSSLSVSNKFIYPQIIYHDSQIMKNFFVKEKIIIFFKSNLAIIAENHD